MLTPLPKIQILTMTRPTVYDNVVNVFMYPKPESLSGSFVSICYKIADGNKRYMFINAEPRVVHIEVQDGTTG